jgi:hypothetical protein
MRASIYFLLGSQGQESIDHQLPPVRKCHHDGDKLVVASGSPSANNARESGAGQRGDSKIWGLPHIYILLAA